MFPEKELVTNPRVLTSVELPPKDFYFTSDRLVGEYYRVIPHTGREVLFLQMLGKNIDVFLPDSGGGLLIRRAVLDKM